MIAGVGIDLVETERMGQKILRPGFREQVFSHDEIQFCEKSVNKFEHYSARFAAKEAFLKAAGTGLTAGYELNEIVVISDDLGKPSIELRGGFLAMASSRNWKSVQVSLSHVAKMACAIVIIEE